MRTQVLKSTWKVRHHPSVITWMEKYCAEYMNIVGLSSGNDCHTCSGFVSWRDSFICSSMLLGVIPVKAITEQDRKLLSLQAWQTAA